ncbi:MAG: CTP synthase [Desulfurellaceae bacterium]|nr:CTP synthase [Desulfurellaceae bacterium]
MKNSKTKFMFVMGGVVSSLGKGIASASTAYLLQSRGINLTMLKIDPYINVDPGTMNPYQHGEVYVLDDGAETDLDLGHYERYTNLTLTQKNNFTSGQIYQTVIMKERRGDYLGKTVQVVPHITDEIKRRIFDVAEGKDLIIVEIGGTIGDIEGQPFIEAIRQMRFDVGRENTLYVILTLIPYIRVSGELKTKPTQHSVKELQSLGIQPDIILCRAEKPLTNEMKGKISLFCNVEKEAVITAIDVKNVYEIPLKFHQEELESLVIKKLNLKCNSLSINEWEKMVYRIKHPKDTVNIAFVGKYTKLKESYKSLIEAFVHAGAKLNVHVNLNWVDAEQIDSSSTKNILSNMDGMLVPGGFGERGIEGKIKAIKYARESKVPFLGICLGMQGAVIEFARDVARLNNADSEEFHPEASCKIIHLAKKWIKDEKIIERDEKSEKGGTMRLGAYPCQIKKGTKAYQAYNKELIYERHRHRYEFNNDYRKVLEEKGLIISGESPDGEFVEIAEIKNHPFFVGTQFHPEFKSRPLSPHPLILEFVKNAYEKRRTKEKHS